jgi:lipoprotein
MKFLLRRNDEKNNAFSCFSNGGGLAFSGCANSQLQNTNFYNTQKYQNAHAKCGNSNVNANLESKINEKLRQKNKIGEAITIQCDVQNFDEGNRFTRYMLGGLGGAGKATSLTKINILDANNVNIGNFEISAELGIGIFGGSSDEMIEATATKIVNIVEEKFIY